MARTRFSRTPRVTFHGAAGEVTGSMHRLEVLGKSLLLDCGFVQGNRADSYRRNSTFPFRPKDIDAVVLSHAHIDHSGNLPNLLKQGFSGPIFCTPATRALVAVMLGDAAKIQAEDCRYLNKRREPGEPALEPLYGEGGVYKTLLRLQAVPYGQTIELFAGVRLTFHDAGHLLGSAMALLDIEGNRLLYTGDRGRPGIPLLKPPEPLPQADYVICESTYGGRTHLPVEETAEQLGAIVRRVVARGGKLIVPAFSVGRTQTVLYYLHVLRASGAIPAVPIYVDSPMAVRATEVFRSHPECFDASALELICRYPDLFGDAHVTYTEKQHQSVALNHLSGPAILISASGMCEAGRVVHHLRHHLEDSRAAVALAGFQAEGTLGRRLIDGQQTVRVLGREVRVRAEILSLSGLSSHADHQQLLNDLAPLRESVQAVRLVHGEPEPASQLAEALRAGGFREVAVPHAGQEWELATRLATEKCLKPQ
ncbi:MAG: MBL fold metallo-hydrolase [Gemmataceae bacterium]